MYQQTFMARFLSFHRQIHRVANPRLQPHLPSQNPFHWTTSILSIVAWRDCFLHGCLWLLWFQLQAFILPQISRDRHQADAPQQCARRGTGRHSLKTMQACSQCRTGPVRFDNPKLFGNWQSQSRQCHNQYLPKPASVPRTQWSDFGCSVCVWLAGWGCCCELRVPVSLIEGGSSVLCCSESQHENCLRRRLHNPICRESKRLSIGFSLYFCSLSIYIYICLSLSLSPSLCPLTLAFLSLGSCSSSFRWRFSSRAASKASLACWHLLACSTRCFWSSSCKCPQRHCLSWPSELLNPKESGSLRGLRCARRCLDNMKIGGMWQRVNHKASD